MSTIVNIDHETGDLSQYTSVVSGAGLSVSAAAALAGTNYGLLNVVKSHTPAYTEYSLSEANITGILRIRIYLKFITRTDGVGAYIFECLDSSGTVIIRIANNSSYLEFHAQASEGLAAIGTVNIADADFGYFEIHYTRSTEFGADAIMHLYAGGEIAIDIHDNNYYGFTDFKTIRVGLMGDSNPGVTPNFQYYIDEIIINDDGSEIGADVIPSPVEAATFKKEMFEGIFREQPRGYYQ